jgi:hypothetical protein
MGVDLRVQIDIRQFVERMEFSAKEAVNAIRRTIDRTARAARKDAIKTMSKDIGVSVSKFKDAVPLVKASTQSNLSASWTVKKKGISILNVGTFSPILSANRGSFSGSTFRLTGGGSSNLSIGKAFIVHTKNGGTFLAVRTGKGKGDFKAIWAEMPNTALGQNDGAPRKEWERSVGKTLAPTMEAEIQRALDGTEGPSPSTIGGD